jgi:hypothetical protein
MIFGIRLRISGIVTGRVLRDFDVESAVFPNLKSEMCILSGKKFQCDRRTVGSPKNLHHGIRNPHS